MGPNQAPGFARTTVNCISKAPAKLRRLWKEARRYGGILAQKSGLEKIVQDLLTTFGARSPSQSPAPLSAPSREEAKSDGAEQLVESPPRQRKPLRVRFRSPPHQVVKTPDRVQQPSPYRVEKPLNRVMEQQRKRRDLLTRLKDLSVSNRTQRTQRISKPPKEAEQSTDFKQETNEGSKGTKRNGSSTHLPKASKDASTNANTLTLDNLSIRDSVPQGVPLRRSSTGISSASRLLGGAERPKTAPGDVQREAQHRRRASLRSADAQSADASSSSAQSADAQPEDPPKKQAPRASPEPEVLIFSNRRRFARNFARKKALRDAEAKRLAQEADETAAQARKARRGPLNARPEEAVIQILSAAREKSLNADLATPADHVLAHAPVEITRRDLGSLLPQRGTADNSIGWLNDTIITAAMAQVVEHGNARARHQKGQVPRFHAFSTFFYTTFKDRGHASVRRFGRRAGVMGTNLLQCEVVFIPVHRSSHWTLLVVYPTTRFIEYYDSLGGDAEEFLDDAKAWLAAELGEAWDEDEWEVREGDSPQQNNGKDCGVFLVTTAKMLMLGWNPKLTYGSRHMVTQRRRIAAELLAGGYREDLAPPEPAHRWELYETEEDGQ